MLSSFVCLRNFLGFRLNDKHNASKIPNMSWRESCSIRCKNMKIIKQAQLYMSLFSHFLRFIVLIGVNIDDFVCFCHDT